MLIFKDVLGTEVPAYVSDVAETQNLSEIGQLDFTIMNTPKNELAFPMVAPRTLVTVPETGRQYRLSANAGMSQGIFKQRTITALHVGHDLHDKFIDSQLIGSQSLEACMSFLTKGTKFSFVIHDSFNHYSFSEGFGNGFADALFLDNLKNDYGFEFYFDNYVIHIYKSLGKKNQFFFIDNANCQKIADSSDYTTISTHIKGVGKRDDKGKSIVTAEYTSPNAKVYGIIDAEKVDDESFTKKDSLLNYLKIKLQDYPLVQYTIDATNFENNLSQGKLSKLKIGDYGFLRDRFDVDIETRLTGLVTYPQAQTPPKVTFGNKKMSMSQITVSLMKNRDHSKKVDVLSGEIKDADEKATNAFKSRLYGEVEKEIEKVKAYRLIAPEDNDEMGLSKGESYFVLTHAQSVEGLTEFVQELLPKCELKTKSVPIQKNDNVSGGTITFYKSAFTTLVTIQLNLAKEQPSYGDCCLCDIPAGFEQVQDSFSGVLTTNEFPMCSIRVLITDNQICARLPGKVEQSGLTFSGTIPYASADSEGKATGLRIG